MYSISVVLAVKNEEETIEQIIQSILKQTLYDFELIIVNDNSTDNTEEICRKYEEKEPLIIEVINLSGMKQLSAWNIGLELARGEYIYFAGTQLTFDKTMLEDNLNLAQEQKSDLVVCGFEKKISSNKEEVITSLPNIPQLKNQKQFRKHYRNFHNFYPYTVKNKIYKRSYLLRNNILFDEKSFNVEANFNLATYRNINAVAINRKNLLSFCELESKDINRFEYDIKRAFILEKMLEEWNMIEIFEDVIFNEYFDILNMKLTTIGKNQATNSRKKTTEELSLILNNHYVNEFLKNYKEFKIKNPFKKMLIKSLYQKDFNQILRQTMLNNKISDSHNKAKNFLGKLF